MFPLPSPMGSFLLLQPRQRLLPLPMIRLPPPGDSPGLLLLLMAPNLNDHLLLLQYQNLCCEVRQSPVPVPASRDLGSDPSIWMISSPVLLRSNLNRRV